MNYKRKIYSTTDGYFNFNDHISKKRFIVVLYQRKDGALGVAKLYSKNDKSGVEQS